MTAKEFILSVDENAAHAANLGYELILVETEILEWMELYAQFKVEQAQGKCGTFETLSFKLSWTNSDHIKIAAKRIAQHAVIRSAHFDGMLMALLASTPYKNK
jgi:hypothetical protein